MMNEKSISSAEWRLKQSISARARPWITLLCMPIARPGIEQPFDVGAVIIFRDRGALENYEKDPRHLAAMREILKPLAKRHVIYNFSGD